MIAFLDSLSTGAAALLSSLVGGLLTVAAMFVSPFAEDFRNRVLASKKDDPLLGRWRATWTAEDRDATERPEVVDTVCIEKVRSSLVEGRGENTEFGGYRLSGRQSQFVITLSFWGEGRNENLQGVVILKKGAQSDVMNGVWCQYSPRHELVNGEVLLEKVRHS